MDNRNKHVGGKFDEFLEEEFALEYGIADNVSFNPEGCGRLTEECKQRLFSGHVRSEQDLEWIGMAGRQYKRGDVVGVVQWPFLTWIKNSREDEIDLAVAHVNDFTNELV